MIKRQVIYNVGLSVMWLAGLLIGLSGCVPASAPSMAEAEAGFHMGQADFFLDEGLTDSALAAFGLAIEENPKITDAHIGMGHIYRDRGNFRLASASYQHATKLEPNNFDAHYYLGLSYHLWGKIDEAVKTYLRALVIRPESYDANHHLGSALLQQGRVDEAVTYAQRAANLQKDSMAAWANLGAAQRLMGNYEEAVEAYRAANELGEAQTPVLLGMADCLIKLKRYPQATNVLNVLLSREKDAVAYERLGFCYFKQAKYQTALKHYNAALELDADDTSALNGRGVCLMTQFVQSAQRDRRKRDQAIEAWQRSVEIRPKQPRIIDLITRYQR